jgi:hypothetical protein
MNAVFSASPKYLVKASAPAGVLALAGSGMPDAVVAEPDAVELVDVAGAVELDEPAVLDVDSTGGEDAVVHADVNAASPRTTATPTPLNRRRTSPPLTHP